MISSTIFALRRRVVLALVGRTCLAATATAFAQTPAYQMVDLGTLGGNISYAYGINNAGQIVGYADLVSTPRGPEHAALWTVNGGIIHCTDLGTLGGDVSIAYNVNNAGQIVGTSFLSGSGQHAALFTALGTGTTITDLGTYLGGTSEAHGIDDAGHIVGFATVSKGTYSNYYALLFGQNGNGAVPAYLGAPGGTASRARAITPAGLIVGDDLFTEPSRTAARATSFGVAGATLGRTDLGSFGDNNSTALATSRKGQIAGYAFVDGTFTTHMVIFGAPGTGGIAQDLGVLPGGSSAIAQGINNVGQVVGNGDGGTNNSYVGLLYTPATGVLDLGKLVSPALAVGTFVTVQNQGTPINDWGQIAANANIGPSTGVVAANHAVLLNPIMPLTTTSGATQDTRLVAGGSYAQVPPFANPTSGSNATTFAFLGGIAGSGGAGVYGQNRDVSVSFVGNPASTALATDAASLGSTSSDMVVAQMSYAPGLASTYFGQEVNGCLGWFDGARWANAVDGNTGGAALFAGNRAYNAATDFHLGIWGIDPGHAVAWAVVNHGGTFAVTINPEVLRRVQATSRSGTVTTLTLNGFTGHVYQLQRASALTGGPNSFTNVENAQSGTTGSTIHFSHDDGVASEGFYQIKIDP